MKADIGVIGLAVMGQNLARNMESRGYTVAVYNRTAAKTRELIEAHGKGRKLVAGLQPRGVRGQPRETPQGIHHGEGGQTRRRGHRGDHPPAREGRHHHRRRQLLLPRHDRRTREAEAKGLRYIGTGVSGGEEGALLGPSIMPGGDP